MASCVREWREEAHFSAPAEATLQIALAALAAIAAHTCWSSLRAMVAVNRYWGIVRNGWAPCASFVIAAVLAAAAAVCWLLLGRTGKRCLLGFQVTLHVLYAVTTALALVAYLMPAQIDADVRLRARSPRDCHGRRKAWGLRAVHGRGPAAQRTRLSLRAASASPPGGKPRNAPPAAEDLGLRPRRRGGRRPRARHRLQAVRLPARHRVGGQGARGRHPAGLRPGGGRHRGGAGRGFVVRPRAVLRGEACGQAQAAPPPPQARVRVRRAGAAGFWGFGPGTARCCDATPRSCHEPQRNSCMGPKPPGTLPNIPLPRRIPWDKIKIENIGPVTTCGGAGGGGAGGSGGGGGGRCPFSGGTAPAAAYGAGGEAATTAKKDN